MEFQKVSKRAIWNMLIAALIWVILLAIAALLVWSAMTDSWQPGTTVTAVYWTVAVIVLAGVFCSPWIRYYRYRYQINDVRIAKREGLLFVTTEIAPIERVHQIAVNRGPIDRLTGLAKVQATTAGGEITIRFLEYQTAVRLSEQLETTIKTLVKAQEELQ